MEVHGLKCTLCGDTIYSRAGHDFRFCTCGNIFVDGGQEDHGRHGYHVADSYEPAHLTVKNITKKDLFHDWNNRTDKYGLVHGAEFTDEMRQRARLKIKLRFGQ